MSALPPRGYRCHEFAGQVIALEWADARSATWVADLLQAPPASETAALPDAVFRLHSEAQGAALTVFAGAECLYRGEEPARGLHALLEAMMAHWRQACTQGLLLHAGLLSHAGGGLLLAGPSGAGKSTLSAWLCQHGLDYHGDELAYTGAGHWQGLARALVLKGDWSGRFPALAGSMPSWLQADDQSLLPSALFQTGARATAAHCQPGLLLFPHYRAGADFALTRLSPARAALRLVEAVVNGGNLPQRGMADLSALARQCPAYQLDYGGFEQLGPWLASLPGLIAQARQTRQTQQP